MRNWFIALIIASGTFWPELVCAEVTQLDQGPGRAMYDVSSDSWQPEEFDGAITVPAAFAEHPAITLDGSDDEPAWANATEVHVPLSHGRLRDAWVKAIYTDDEVFIRLRWEDATEDREYHPWVWDAEQARYVAGPQVEDSVILSFEAGCWWAPSLLEGVVFDFDGWQWLAARSDPVGQAVDIDGSLQDRDLTSLGFARYQSRHDEEIWSLRIADGQEDALHKKLEELDRTYSRQPVTDTVYYRGRPDGSESEVLGQPLSPPEAPPTDPAESVPQYQAVPFAGDAADVRAKGRWQGGYWTVEFNRARVTEGNTTTDSLLNRLSQFSIHVFDQTERIDEVSESGRLFLQFMTGEEALAQE